MMTHPKVGLSLMLEEDYLQAAFPLFEAGDVEVVEWSFDIGWGPEPLPDWADELLDYYSRRAILLGHGVTFSPLSADSSQRQEQWLQRLAEECQCRSYQHISEHFGFSSAGSFHDSAPLPVPRTPAAIQLGQEWLLRLATVAGVPVGLENLAFAFGPQDVHEQGPFLDALLRPVDGFLLLDLHNIYCQMCNFQKSAADLLDNYPLHRVRELHVSGGSWSESTSIPEATPVRRDTHDGAVPDAVFDLVTFALERCAHVEAVIFERLGNTLPTGEDAAQFRADFGCLKKTVQSCSPAENNGRA